METIQMLDDTASVEHLKPLDRFRMTAWLNAVRLVLSNSTFQFELGYEMEDEYESFKRYVPRQTGLMKLYEIQPGSIRARVLSEAEEQS